MIFKISKTTTDDVSDILGAYLKEGEWFIDIDTVEELLKLCDDNPIVITNNKTIEIYNWYRE